MLLRTKEVAALLRVHPKHVYRLMKRGLPAQRVGDEWRFDEAAALRWTGGGGEITAKGPAAEAAPGMAPPLLAGNGDLALEILLDGLRESRMVLGHVQADHATGLELLRDGAVLAAGCHGDAPPVAGREPFAWVHLAIRELGVAFERGRRVRRLSSIVGKRLASRPSTAGIRAHLDQALRRDGIDPAEAHANAVLHPSHREAVMAIVRGEAEFALASRAWAVRAGLGFLPLASEGYGLALRATTLGQAPVAALGELAQSARYRKRLTDDFGYDARRAGEVRFGAPSAPA